MTKAAAVPKSLATNRSGSIRLEVYFSRPTAKTVNSGKKTNSMFKSRCNDCVSELGEAEFERLLKKKKPKPSYRRYWDYGGLVRGDTTPLTYTPPREPLHYTKTKLNRLVHKNNLPIEHIKAFLDAGLLVQGVEGQHGLANPYNPRAHEAPLLLIQQPQRPPVNRQKRDALRHHLSKKTGHGV